MLGRFISADTIVPEPGNPQEFNRYTYVENNPIKYIDPDGGVALLAPAVIARVINGFIGAFAGGSAAYTVAIAGNNTSHSSPSFQAFIGGLVGFGVGVLGTSQAAGNAGQLAAVATTSAIAYASDVFGQIIGGSPNGVDLFAQPVFSASVAPLAAFTGSAVAARVFAKSSSALFTIGANGSASGLIVPKVPHLFSGVAGSGLFGGIVQGVGTTAGSYIPSPRFNFNINGITIETSNGFGIPTNLSFQRLLGQRQSASSSVSANLNVNSSNPIRPDLSGINSPGTFGGDFFSSPSAISSGCAFCGGSDINIRGNNFDRGRFDDLFNFSLH